MAFAMICNNRIIDILHNQDIAPAWPPDMSGNPVTAVECPDEAKGNWRYDPITNTVMEPTEVEKAEKPASQMDKIEKMLNALTAGTVTEAAISAAILEGVNEV